jgi:hypothetical protein
VAVEWRGDVYSTLASGALAEGLNDGAEFLRAASVARAPKLDGILRGSAGVNEASSGNFMAVVYFDTPYAVRQHEELGWRHDDGTARYVAGPLEENADAIIALIGAPLGRIT